MNLLGFGFGLATMAISALMLYDSRARVFSSSSIALISLALGLNTLSFPFITGLPNDAASWIRAFAIMLLFIGFIVILKTPLEDDPLLYRAGIIVIFLAALYIVMTPILAMILSWAMFILSIYLWVLSIYLLSIYLWVLFWRIIIIVKVRVLLAGGDARRPPPQPLIGQQRRQMQARHVARRQEAPILVRMPPRLIHQCAYCHSPINDGQYYRCPTCGSTFHTECASLIGFRCSRDGARLVLTLVLTNAPG